MKRIIVTEEQVKKIVDLLINEQKPNDVNIKTLIGNTDGQRVSHAYLEKTYGLPNGSKYENYHYSANIKDVIEMSKNDENSSKFLSVFKPTNDYGNDVKNSYDYIKVNNEILNQPGSKVFNFLNGTVVASHNGLLALVRTMIDMDGVGSYMKITFGVSKEGDAAYNERGRGSGVFNSTQALNLNLDGLSETFADLSMNPNVLKNANTQYNSSSIEQIKNIAPKIINSLIKGIGYFVDYKYRNDVIKFLEPKGYIMTLNYDLNGVINKLVDLQKTPDFNELKKYNVNKQIALNNVSKEFFNDLGIKIKEAYVHNFKIYIENMMPENKDKILPLIQNIKLNITPIGNQHKLILSRGDFGRMIYDKTNTETKYQNVDPGKIK
jgi:hypothetical protein